MLSRCLSRDGRSPKVKRPLQTIGCNGRLTAVTLPILTRSRPQLPQSPGLGQGRSPENIPLRRLLQFVCRIITSHFLLRSLRNPGVISRSLQGPRRQKGDTHPAAVMEGYRYEGEVPLVSKNEERYLLQALEFEGVLRACLYRYTRNSADVEELLQETYARLLVAGASTEPEVRSVRAFSLTIARNVAFDWLRHKQVVPIELVADMEALDVLDERDQIDAIVNSHQELMMLVKAVQQLPERCRQVFTLRKVYGYSQKEIAARMKISENTVEQQLIKAARHCAQALFDQPVAERPGTM